MFFFYPRLTETERLRSSSKTECKQHSPPTLTTSRFFLLEPVTITISVWMLRAAKWIGWLCYFIVYGSAREKNRVVWQGFNHAGALFGRCCVLINWMVFPLKILN